MQVMINPKFIVSAQELFRSATSANEGTSYCAIRMIDKTVYHIDCPLKDLKKKILETRDSDYMIFQNYNTSNDLNRQIGR